MSMLKMMHAVTSQYCETPRPVSWSSEMRHCPTLFPAYVETNRMFLEGSQDGQLVRQSVIDFLQIEETIKNRHFLSSYVESSQLIQRNLDQIRLRSI
jgi:hypothetical protein